jgi:hypothetical protein
MLFELDTNPLQVCSSDNAGSCAASVNAKARTRIGECQYTLNSFEQGTSSL